jgi:hypothetical protein
VSLKPINKHAVIFSQLEVLLDLRRLRISNAHNSFNSGTSDIWESVRENVGMGESAFLSFDSPQKTSVMCQNTTLLIEVCEAGRQIWTRKDMGESTVMVLLHLRNSSSCQYDFIRRVKKRLVQQLERITTFQWHHSNIHGHWREKAA